MPHGKKKVQPAVDNETGAEIDMEEKPHNRLIFIVIAAILVIMAGVGGILYYRSTVAPFQRPAVIIDKTPVSMGYFLKRLKLANTDYSNLIAQLVQEQIVKERAADFGITVSAQDIDNALLYNASTENATDNTTPSLSESDFKKWYSHQLEQTGLTDAEYRDIVRTNMLAAGMQQFLAENIATSADQVRLSVMLLASAQDVTRAKARIAAGESFAAVARDMSLDTQTKDKGGEIGWIPPGVLPYDNVIFNLEAGTISDPVQVDPSQPATTQYLLFMVLEKASGRQIDDGWLQVLKSRALYNWLSTEAPSHSVDVAFDFSNTENQAWIQWQLTKAK